MVLNGNSEEINNFAKWEFNSFFLETIIPALDYMINEGHGHPADITPTEWDKILKEMKEGFELIKNNIQDTGWSLRKDLNIKDKSKVDKSFDLFKEHFFDLWD